jgi:hypothetical protein
MVDGDGREASRPSRLRQIPLSRHPTALRAGRRGAGRRSPPAPASSKERGPPKRASRKRSLGARACQADGSIGPGSATASSGGRTRTCDLVIRERGGKTTGFDTGAAGSSDNNKPRGRRTGPPCGSPSENGGKRWSRDELLKGLDERGQSPSGQFPKNTLGNRLGEMVERGELGKDGDQFFITPRGHAALSEVGVASL